MNTASTARPARLPASAQRRPCCNRSSAGPITGATSANGAMVTSRYRATLPRWASEAAAKNSVPASETAIIASPAMCRALTQNSPVRPVSWAPSARPYARTRRTAAPLSSRVREAATRVTVTLGGRAPGPGEGTSTGIVVGAVGASSAPATGIGRVC
jgi:hypothetical protein